MRLALSFSLAALTIAAPRLAAASSVTFDTVDDYEVFVNNQSNNNTTVIRVRGIVTGSTAPNTLSFTFSFASAIELAPRCDRLALLAQAKPGKYLLTITDGGPSPGCKLSLRTP